MTYTNFNATDLRGSTLADYLVAIEAEFQLRDGELIIYEESCFPVVELARSLHIWLSRQDDRDFVFDSLSFENPGSVTIVHDNSGWVFSSIFTPAVQSTAIGRQEVQECILSFEAKVLSDLNTLGIEPRKVFGDDQL